MQRWSMPLPGRSPSWPQEWVEPCLGISTASISLWVIWVYWCYRQSFWEGLTLSRELSSAVWSSVFFRIWQMAILAVTPRAGSKRSFPLRSWSSFYYLSLMGYGAGCESKGSEKTWNYGILE